MLKELKDYTPSNSDFFYLNRLVESYNWLSLCRAKNEEIYWAEFQGEMPLPLKVVIDLDRDCFHCTCEPCRPPCDHILALGIIQLKKERDFKSVTQYPSWVEEWRKGSPVVSPALEVKMMTDKEALTKKKAADRRKKKNDVLITQGLLELEQWICDQLAAGLGRFMEHAKTRCREIRERLVDAKATILAERIDQIPIKLEKVGRDQRVRFLIHELGKISWLIRAWRNNPQDPDILRSICRAESKDIVFELADKVSHKGIWRMLAEFSEPLDSGLTKRSIWFCLAESGVVKEPTLGLIVEYQSDHLKRKKRRRAGEENKIPKIESFYTFQTGEFIYFPSVLPLRGAFISLKSHKAVSFGKFDLGGKEKFFSTYSDALSKIPWLEEMPYILPPGRFMQTRLGEEVTYWWQSRDEKNWQLPIYPTLPGSETNGRVLMSSDLDWTFILWDGIMARVGLSGTQWGII